MLAIGGEKRAHRIFAPAFKPAIDLPTSSPEALLNLRKELLNQRGRAGQTSRKGVASVLNTLHRLRANVVGMVLNEVHKEISDTYYYYGYYGKYYKYYRPDS